MTPFEIVLGFMPKLFNGPTDVVNDILKRSNTDKGVEEEMIDKVSKRSKAAAEKQKEKYDKHRVD